MRQVELDYKKEDISEINREIVKLTQNRAYSKLSFLCFEKYMNEGNLDTKLKKDEYENSIDTDNFG